MAPSTPVRGRWRLSPLRLLQLALVAAFSAIIVLNTHFGRLDDALHGIDSRLLLLVVALNIPVLLLVPVRSALVLRCAGYRPPAGILFVTSVLGYVAGGITPGASGELMRVQALRDAAGVPLEKALAVAAYERVLSLSMQMLFVIPVVAVVVLSPAWGLVAAVGCIAVWALSSLAASLILAHLPDGSSVTGSGLVSRAWRYVLLLSHQLSFLVASRRLYVWASLISLALVVLFVAQAWLMCRSIGGEVSPSEAAVAYLGSILASVASFIPLGAGIGDGSMATLLRKFGMTLEQGEVVALLLRVLVTVPLLITALGCYLYLQGRIPLRPAEDTRAVTSMDSKSAPALSVLIVSYQGMAYLQACLESFLDQDLGEPYEVIVIDNASQDGSADYVAQAFPRVRLVRLPANVGYGAANNVGAAAASGDVLVIVNQDTVAHRGLLRAFLTRLRSADGPAACEPNLIHPWFADYAGISQRATPLGFHYADLTALGYVDYQRAPHAVTEVETTFLTGACFAIRRDVVSKLGYLFDSSFFMYGEDVDLSLRLQARGLRMVALRDAVIYHSHHLDSSLGWRSFRKTVSIIRNRLLAYRNTLTTAQYVAKLPLLLAGGPMNAFAFGTPPARSALNFVCLLPTTALAFGEALLRPSKPRSSQP